MTKGDLTRSITVEAQGEVAALKDNINEMIRNLKDTTQKNTEQDWLKTNLAKFSRMLQGQQDLLTVGRLILSELAPVVSAQQGVFYVLDDHGEGRRSSSSSRSYACKARARLASHVQARRGAGRPVRAREAEDPARPTSRRTTSRSPPASARRRRANIIVLPVLFEGQVKARDRAGLASSASTRRTRRSSTSSPSRSASCSTRSRPTCAPRSCSSSRSRWRDELQTQQEELQQTNQELAGEGAACWPSRTSRSNARTRRSSRPGRRWRRRPQQLALTSKYKSEFLANMSHELRTPLNSLLILSDQLSENPDGNLTPQAGRVRQDDPRLGQRPADADQRHPGSVEDRVGHGRRRRRARCAFDDLRDYVERTFRHVAEAKRLRLRRSSSAPAAAAARITTDAKRLQQVLKNLLSNAFKFTEQGRGDAARSSRDRERLEPEQRDARTRADTVLAFSVRDTGIGIPPDKQQIIFEAFQQADGIDQPQVRRHRPRPGHQPRDRAAARRRDPAREHARRAAARSRCTCRAATRRRSARPTRAAATVARICR